MRRWRKTTWAIITWVTGVAVWGWRYTVAVAAAPHATRSASSTGFGLLFIGTVGVVGLLVLLMLWSMLRPQ